VPLPAWATPRDVYMRELDLSRSDERQRVHEATGEYSLRESETRTLATIGAFLVVSSRDLSDLKKCSCREVFGFVFAIPMRG
jgi:hypothetical protein